MTVHLYHRHGAVWCGYGVAEPGRLSTRDVDLATCADCLEIAAAFTGANKACGCAECTS